MFQNVSCCHIIIEKLSIFWKKLSTEIMSYDIRKSRCFYTSLNEKNGITFGPNPRLNEYQSPVYSRIPVECTSRKEVEYVLMAVFIISIPNFIFNGSKTKVNQCYSMDPNCSPLFVEIFFCLKLQQYFVNKLIESAKFYWYQKQ